MSSTNFLHLPRQQLRRRKIFGGIKPATHKAASLRSRIMPMPLPPQLILPINQYHGTNSSPLVKVGDAVLKYQALTEKLDHTGAALHAPTSGRITAICSASIAGHPGNAALCIHLQCDGDDNSLELQPCLNHDQLTGFEVLRKIDAAGIVGMGGAGFPTAHKLRLATEHGTELLIINAAECEPYISTDEALLRERAREVVIGAELLRTACHAPRCGIAIEEDKPAAIAALRTALAHSPIELMLLHSTYPTGGEKQIVQAVTGLEVPVGQYPLNLGILVHNAGTAYAVYQAVAEGKPSISRIITLTGRALQTPKNFEALIGTPVAFLLKLCGVQEQHHLTTVMGGSLMGLQLAHAEVPVTKTTNCLIAATVEDFPQPEPELACIRCGFCAEVCPARLLPQQLYSFARTHNHTQLQSYGLDDCIECGACAYVCPSNIPLVQYYVAAKQELRTLSVAREQSEHWQTRFQFHQYRTKQEKDSARERRIPTALSPVELLPTDSSPITSVQFSRQLAQQEIADAVARANAKRTSRLATDTQMPQHPAKDKE